MKDRVSPPVDHTPSKQAAKTIEIRAPPEHRPATVTWLESAHFIGWNSWIEFGKLLCFGGGEFPVVRIKRVAPRGSIESRWAPQAAEWVEHGARCQASRCSARREL